MTQDWAQSVAQQLIQKSGTGAGATLLLGAADTGKTTLAQALANEIATEQSVAIVDADIGQSHIGPPTTVGWAVADSKFNDLSALDCRGIGFVGHVTPVGHLLQLTTALTICVNEAAKYSKTIIIDTPGLVHGHVACALWWAVERMVRPRVIAALQHNNELTEILAGINSKQIKVETITTPADLKSKSPEQRYRYRQRQFEEYFRDSRMYQLNLKEISVQRPRQLSSEEYINRLVALRDGAGIDTVIGIIMDWSEDKIVVRAPEVDVELIHTVVVGDISVTLGNG